MAHRSGSFFPMSRKLLSYVPFVTVSRVAEASIPYGTKCDAPEMLAEFWEKHIATRPGFEPEKEALYVILLDVKFQVIAANLVSLGSVNESVAHPREILRPAIALGAHSLVIMHNHPSGDVQPSGADTSVTKRLREACDLLQIKLLDHVIYGGPGNFFSFKNNCYL